MGMFKSENYVCTVVISRGGDQSEIIDQGELILK